MTYDHQSQYDPGSSAITRSSGCTWTTGANGVAAISGGASHPSPDTIHSLVKRSEETDPNTPGWSLPDLALAMSRYGVTFSNRTGDGWSALKSLHDGGHYIALQGDSDQFGNSSCSGSFDGTHCIGIFPRSRVVDGVTEWWIDDPICPTGRWERVSVLARYAAKLDASIRFGVYPQLVVRQWQCVIPARTLFRVFTVNAGVIRSVRSMSLPRTLVRSCTPPHTYPWPGHAPQTLVRNSGGAYVQARYAHEVNA